jgi:4-amino-4-deoxy-L-arabinose transferase-like glycosyltransferase
MPEKHIDIGGVLLSRSIVSVFALGFVARVAAQALLGAYVHPQTWEYEEVANSLLSGHGYTYALHGTPYVAALASPSYVLLTAGVYLLTGHSQPFLLALQALLGGATAALAGWLAARMFRPEAAWSAGVLVAIDPALLVFAAELHPLTLDALAFLALVCACVWLCVRPGWPTTGLIDLLLGMAALTRTTILSLLPILVVWLNRFRGLTLGSAVALTAPAYAGHNTARFGLGASGTAAVDQALCRPLPDPQMQHFSSDNRPYSPRSHLWPRPPTSLPLTDSHLYGIEM